MVSWCRWGQKHYCTQESSKPARSPSAVIRKHWQAGLPFSEPAQEQQRRHRVARCGAVPWSNPRPKMGEMNYAHLWAVGGGTPGVSSLSVPMEPTNSLLNLLGEKRSRCSLYGGELAATRADSQVPLSAHTKWEKMYFGCCRSPRSQRTNVCKLAYSSMLARCNVIEETRCLPGPMF